MNIIYEVADYLQDNGHGTIGTDIFIGSLPNDIENGIMVTSTSSGNNRKDYPVFEANIEIWTRNKSTETGFTKAQNIFTFLNRAENVTLANTHIYFIHSPNGVESIGRDLNDRALHKLIINITFRDLLIS